MSFQHFYGLGPRLRDSRLTTIPESAYRTAAPPNESKSSIVRKLEAGSQKLEVRSWKSEAGSL